MLPSTNQRVTWKSQPPGKSYQDPLIWLEQHNTSDTEKIGNT